MRTQNFYLKLTLVLITAAMLSACGAAKNATYDQSSRLNPDTMTTTDLSNRPLAYCNQATNSTLSVATSTYQDGETISLTKINLKMLKVPSSFSQGQTYLEFHKYMISGTGSKMWGANRLTVSMYSIADGKALATGKGHLYWPDLQSAAAKLGVSTPDQLFKRARIVVELDDYNGDYDVISAIYYNSSDDSVISQLDSLIPVFDADPAKYAYEKDGSKRSSILQALHPFKAYVNQGWTSQNFQTKSMEFCDPIYTVQ